MQKATRTKRHQESDQRSKTAQEETPILMDRSSLEIDQADLLLLQHFHPSPYVRQAASELNWNLFLYNRFKANKGRQRRNPTPLGQIDD